jgi:hypothetical protein
MTDDERTLADIADDIEHGAGWYAQFQESVAEMRRRHPEGYEITKPGEHAWQQLTPVQRALALPQLWHAYHSQLNEEERAQQLDQAAAEVKTYLQADDEYLLHVALNTVRPIGDDTKVNGVYASCLSNVLDELALIRHRLHMATNGGNQ